MNIVLKLESIMPEQSFMWKNPTSTTHNPVLEIVRPNSSVGMVDGMLDFTMVGVGPVGFMVSLVHAPTIYMFYLEGLMRATPDEQRSLREFIPQFIEQTIDSDKEYAITFGGGINGILDAKLLSTHDHEDEAHEEINRVTDQLMAGNLSVLMDETSGKPLIGLEEGVELLTSLMSWGMDSLSPN